ncbi:putative C6 transcription factor [Halenospora varia]|nr:putative C6 transcription factor [Halenospora varia]
MVFCGIPSKACQRCRIRKLRCDLRIGSCSSCLRANAVCTGYRDTEQLRIRDESKDIKRKAVSQMQKQKQKQKQLQLTLQSGPYSLPMSIEVQARHAFFANYVTGSRANSWDFLKIYYNPADAPDFLKTTIDAVSLAYLASKVYSEAVVRAAKEKYVSALSLTTKALRSPDTARKDSALLTSLLLDLFEKIMNEELRNGNNNAWTNHVDGALTLVKLRGLGEFQGDMALRVLVRLSINLLICCVASGSPVPNGLTSLWTYAGSQLKTKVDPKWHLTSLMLVYANLRSEILRKRISVEKYIELSVELDARLSALTVDMPPFWQYTTTVVHHKSERVLDNHYDSYADRHVTQTWNVIRLVRILLNEFLLDYCSQSTGCLLSISHASLSVSAYDNIERMSHEICASLPQYSDCTCAAREKLVSENSSAVIASETPTHSLTKAPIHTHSVSHQADVYTVMFPLYVAGRARGAPRSLREWAIRQYHYISGHFSIRMAEAVCQILEEGGTVNPWTVYAMLGSYAFTA